MNAIHKKATLRSRNSRSGEIGQSPKDVRDSIISALNNPEYRARTISGISAEAHLRPMVVISAIKSDRKLASAVKVVPARSSDGKLLITTKDRFINEFSFKDKFVDFFASKRVEVGVEDAE